MLNRRAVKSRRIDMNNHAFKYSELRTHLAWWRWRPSHRELFLAHLAHGFETRSFPISLAARPRDFTFLFQIRAIRAISG
jgi:hypothetical protein